MSFWESINQALNSEFAFELTGYLSGFFAFFGIFLYIDMQTKDRVFIVDILFKNRTFDYEKLKERFIIQTIVSTGIWITMLLLAIPFKEHMIIYYLVMTFIIGCQITYSSFVVKFTTKSIHRKGVQSNETHRNHLCD